MLRIITRNQWKPYRVRMRTFDKDELRRRVDEVLYYVWDPIGISDVASTRGEYDSYVPKVLQLVEQHDRIGPISSHLAGIIDIKMGLKANKQKCDQTAQVLLDHKHAVQNRFA